jgi:hypothetical protein
MRSKPISCDDIHRRFGPSAKPLGASVRVARRIGARLLHEAREALPPTIFFFVGFNLIVLTTNLLVAQYLVAVSNFMLAQWERSSLARRCWSPTKSRSCDATIGLR